MSLLLQEVLKQVEQLTPEDQRELIRQVTVGLEAIQVVDPSNEPLRQIDSPLGQKLRAIRVRIEESGIPLLSDAELDQEIAERRGDREMLTS
jgi:hypothetical protein